MVAIYEQYTEEIHREFGYSATWLPNTKLSLGDVGFFRRNRFDRVTSLSEMGVSTAVGEPGEPSDLEYSSADQIQFSWHADAEGNPASATGASTTISVLFSRAHAVVFQALASRVVAIGDLAALAAALLPLGEGGIWQRDYAVITELVRTGPSAVLVSSQANARADFRVRADALAGPCTLAQAAANLSMISASGVAVKALAPGGLTPMFRACAFRSRLRKKPRLEYRGENDAPDHVKATDLRALEFGPLSYADALPLTTGEEAY
jgi:hypothetical protein